MLVFPLLILTLISKLQMILNQILNAWWAVCLGKRKYSKSQKFLTIGESTPKIRFVFHWHSLPEDFLLIWYWQKKSVYHWKNILPYAVGQIRDFGKLFAAKVLFKICMDAHKQTNKSLLNTWPFMDVIVIHSLFMLNNKFFRIKSSNTDFSVNSDQWFNAKLCKAKAVSYPLQPEIVTLSAITVNPPLFFNILSLWWNDDLYVKKVYRSITHIRKMLNHIIYHLTLFCYALV